MYNECDSLTSWHKIALEAWTNQSINIFTTKVDGNDCITHCMQYTSGTAFLTVQVVEYADCFYLEGVRPLNECPRYMTLNCI